MPDRRVRALRYNVTHDGDTGYQEDARLVRELPDFTVTIERGVARFELKYPFDDVGAARKVVEPFAQLWAVESTLTRGPGEFQLVYQGAEFEVASRAISGITDTGSAGVIRSSYPEPPDPDADTDLARVVRNYPRARPAIGGASPDVAVALTGVSAVGQAGNVAPAVLPLAGRSTARSSGQGSSNVTDPLPVNAGPATDQAGSPLPLATSIHLNPDTPPSLADTLNLNSAPPAVEVRGPAVAPTFRLPNDWELRQQEIRGRLNELEGLLREALPAVRSADEARRRIGGNFPPATIDGEGEQPPGTESDVVAGVRAIGDLRAQLGLAAPPDTTLVLMLTRSVQAACAAVVAALRWLRENKGKLGLGFGVGIAQGAGKATWDEITHPDRIGALIHQIQQVGGEAIGSLLGLFF